MPNDILAGLLDVLGAFRPPLTQPSFANCTIESAVEAMRVFLVVAIGWIQSTVFQTRVGRCPCCSGKKECLAHDTVTRDLTARVVLFGSMRPDAVLTALPSSTESGPRGGRPHKRGQLPSSLKLGRRQF